jgi:type I restriction enzyme M protein
LINSSKVRDLILQQDQRSPLEQLETKIKEPNPSHGNDKKQITALEKHKAALELRLSRIDRVLAAIAGQMTDEETKTLILKSSTTG